MIDAFIQEQLKPTGLRQDEYAEVLVRLLDYGVICRDESQVEATLYDRYLLCADLVEDYLAVLGMLTFMTAWNDFFWPVITLNSSNPTVQVALNNLGSGYVPDTAIIMAGTLIGTLPVVVVFLLLGRQIVSGIMAGAVKG